MNRSSLGLFPALVLAAGCGGAPASQYNAPIASLHGIITEASVATPEQLHVALIWSTFGADKHELKSAQEIGVRAEFPVRFQLDVNHLPPESAMNRLDAEDAADVGVDPNSFRFAFGAVLVYDDTNGSGALDLLPPGATSYVDRPLGTAQPFVLYVEGTPPPALFDGAQVNPGFNLMMLSTCAPDGDFCRPKVISIPLQTELQIALSADPRLADIVCQNGLSGGSGSGGVGSGGSTDDGPSTGEPNDGYTPPAEGATVECSADGRSYTVETCTQAGLCGGSDCAVGIQELGPDEPTPAGWPCPLQ